MDRYAFEVSSKDKGTRLDIYLHEKIGSEISRKTIQDMIKEGRVMVNGISVKCHYRIKDSDSISVEIPEAEEIDLKPEDISLEIVFEDDCLLVVNKPPGMLVHPAGGIYSGTLVNALLAHAGVLSGVGGKFKPGIVHRLDRDTSGLLLVAKSDPVHLDLAGQFSRHSIYRRYIAAVKGVVELDEGEIDLPIGRHPYERTRMAVNLGRGREAKTVYRVLKRYEGFTLLEVYPRTGRTHQIRVHMAYMGHPVLGDPVYGAKSNLIGRQALHALEIGFRHPLTGEQLRFLSSLPVDIQGLIPDYII